LENTCQRAFVSFRVRVSRPSRTGKLSPARGGEEGGRSDSSKDLAAVGDRPSRGRPSVASPAHPLLCPLPRPSPHAGIERTGACSFGFSSPMLLLPERHAHSRSPLSPAAPEGFFPFSSSSLPPCFSQPNKSSAYLTESKSRQGRQAKWAAWHVRPCERSRC
jgi:hypothetical protein